MGKFIHPENDQQKVMGETEGETSILRLAAGG